MKPRRRSSDDSPAGESLPRGWRAEFAERWTELALARAQAAGGAHGETALAWAIKALTRSGASLERLVSAQRRATAADYEDCLSSGVAALEACAAVWRSEPATFSEAVRLVSEDGMPDSAAFDAIADAWETYHLVRHMPRD